MGIKNDTSSPILFAYLGGSPDILIIYFSNTLRFREGFLQFHQK